MYEQIRKGRLYLKTLPGQGSINTSGNSSRSIAVLAVILFALSGLISGFAVGAFLHSRSGQPSTSGSGTTSEGQTATSSSSNTSRPKPLGYPQIKNISNTLEKADGTTYTFSIQAVDKQNKPVNASDITCKLWLVQPIPNHAKYAIPGQVLSNINTLQNPITGNVDGSPFPEEVNDLTFDSSTPQTHLCDANGRFTWKYQVSSSLVPGGVYDLVVLTDWQGVHYNWSWINIDIVPAT